MDFGFRILDFGFWILDFEPNFGCYIIYSTVHADPGRRIGVVIGVESMMSIICLLYFSGFVCLLIVLALTICLLIPRMFSFVEVSLPSQMA